MKEITLPTKEVFKYYTPKEIKEHLDKYIIGQDDAKKVLSVAVYNHYKRIIMEYVSPDTVVEKSNVLITGPTGCGKSAMIKCIAEMMGIPYYIADATTLTQAGYVGDDVESILSGLLRNCGWSVSRAEFGIIAIDEIDKIAKRSSNQHITRDVVGEGVQQALLKMVEGSVIGVPPQEGRKHPDQPLIYINTKNILFIGTGAFAGIEDLIKSRLNLKKIGYSNASKIDVDVNSEDFHVYEYLSQDDLRSYGMIPEFIGRFPILTNVNELTKEDLVRILKDPENSVINQFKNLMGVDNITLTIDDDAIEYIAQIAFELGTGARGLRSMMESVLNEFVFDIIDDSTEPKSITITKNDVVEKINKRYSTYINKNKKECA